MNYKTSPKDATDKTIQLTSHAALGAGVSVLTGNDPLSGAVSGVIGEIAGEALYDSVYLTNIKQNQASQLAGLAGGYSAIFTGN